MKSTVLCAAGICESMIHVQEDVAGKTLVEFLLNVIEKTYQYAAGGRSCSIRVSYTSRTLE